MSETVYCERHGSFHESTAGCSQCQQDATQRAAREARERTARALERASVVSAARADPHAQRSGPARCREHEYEWDPETSAGCPLCDVDTADLDTAARATHAQARRADVVRKMNRAAGEGEPRRLLPFVATGLGLGLVLATVLWVALQPSPPPPGVQATLGRIDANRFRPTIEALETSLYAPSVAPADVQARLVALADRLRLELPVDAQPHAMRLAALAWTVGAAARADAAAATPEARARWTQAWEHYVAATFDPAPWMHGAPRAAVTDGAAEAPVLSSR